MTLIHALGCVSLTTPVWTGQISGVRAREEQTSCHVMPTAYPAYLPTCPPPILPTCDHLHLPTCPWWWWCRPPAYLARGRPTSCGACAQFGVDFQIRIAFGLAFPPGDLVISRVLGKTLGYYSLLRGLCLAGGLAFCSLYGGLCLAWVWPSALFFS